MRTPQTEATPELYARIYLVVGQIPAGQVSTYGEIGEIVACDPRLVGYALGDLGAHQVAVPWQRVVNREGGISTRGAVQRAMLEAEGVAFDGLGRVVLARHRWAGPEAAWAAANGVGTLPPRPPEAEQLSMF